MLMLATNSEWAVAVSLTDRRNIVLNVSSSRKNDYEFFNNLTYEQTHGGIETLLKVLMDFDLSDFEIRNIPEKPLRLDLKLTYIILYQTGIISFAIEAFSPFKQSIIANKSPDVIFARF